MNSLMRRGVQVVGIAVVTLSCHHNDAVMQATSPLGEDLLKSLDITLEFSGSSKALDPRDIATLNRFVEVARNQHGLIVRAHFESVEQKTRRMRPAPWLCGQLDR